MNTDLMFSSTNPNHTTPDWFFKLLDDEFHFDFDPDADVLRAKVRDIDHWGKDMLKVDWGKRVFCNPPYGRGIYSWVGKGFDESRKGSLVVMLLPARTDTEWWHTFIPQACEVRFLKGRLKFSGSDNSAPFPSAVVIFKHSCSDDDRPGHPFTIRGYRIHPQIVWWDPQREERT